MLCAHLSQKKLLYYSSECEEGVAGQASSLEEQQKTWTPISYSPPSFCLNSCLPLSLPPPHINSCQLLYPHSVSISSSSANTPDIHLSAVYSILSLLLIVQGCSLSPPCFQTPLSFEQSESWSLFLQFWAFRRTSIQQP